MAKYLRFFEFDGVQLPVTYIESTQVKKGVCCHVYQFDNDEEKDLGIIEIEPGESTPLQKVLHGNRTIEGYISGKGKLIIHNPSGTMETFEFTENSDTFTYEVRIGVTMQWQADSKESLKVFEICFPPYKEGRFENVS